MSFVDTIFTATQGLALRALAALSTTGVVRRTGPTSWDIAAVADSLLAATPGDGVTQTAGSAPVSFRVAFGSIALKPSATNAATMTIAIKDVGGMWRDVIVLTEPVDPTSLTVVQQYCFVVPRGRDYKFTKTMGGGATATIQTYSYMEF